MKRKKYTAQEMRDFASDINQYGLVGACMGKSGNRDGNTIAAMLRQAADVRDRIGELLITYHSCPDQRDLLNFILTGRGEGD